MGGVLVGGGWCGGWVVWCVCVWLIVLCGTLSQAESVAGAAHLPNDYTGVQRLRECFINSPLDLKEKSLLDLLF